MSELCSKYVYLMEAYCSLYVRACSSIPADTIDGDLFRQFACAKYKDVTKVNLDQSVKTFFGKGVSLNG